MSLNCQTSCWFPPPPPPHYADLNWQNTRNCQLLWALVMEWWIILFLKLSMYIIIINFNFITITNLILNFTTIFVIYTVVLKRGFPVLLLTTNYTTYYNAGIHWFSDSWKYSQWYTDNAFSSMSNEIKLITTGAITSRSIRQSVQDMHTFAIFIII